MLLDVYSLIQRDLTRLYELKDRLQPPKKEYSNFINEQIHLYIHALKELAND